MASLLFDWIKTPPHLFQCVSGHIDPEYKRFRGWLRTLLTQNKKLKKKRKYRIQGLTKENVSARFKFSCLSIVSVARFPSELGPDQLLHILGRHEQAGCGAGWGGGAGVALQHRL